MPLQSAESTALQVKAYLLSDTRYKHPVSCMLSSPCSRVYPRIGSSCPGPGDYYRVMGVGSWLHPTGLGAPGPVQDAVALTFALQMVPAR